jgi:hypothetical protein
MKQLVRRIRLRYDEGIAELHDPPLQARGELTLKAQRIRRALEILAAALSVGVGH